MDLVVHLETVHWDVTTLSTHRRVGRHESYLRAPIRVTGTWKYQEPDAVSALNRRRAVLTDPTTSSDPQSVAFHVPVPKCLESRVDASGCNARAVGWS